MSVMTALCPQVRPERRERLPLGLLTFLSLARSGLWGETLRPDRISGSATLL